MVSCACSDFDDKTQAGADQSSLFSYVEIDQAGPNSPWGKGTGDLNGDGLVDAIVGGHQSKTLTFTERVARKLGVGNYNQRKGELVWYESPDFNKHLISNGFYIRTDIESGDIDNDGIIDVIATTDDGIGWFRNPDWSFHLIDDRKYHDIEVSDYDRDGELEVVARNQSLFGYNDGDAIHLFDRAFDRTWQATALEAPHGEGLLVDDINGDGLPDIVVNRIGYLGKRDGALNESWQRFDYTDDPKWANVFVSAGDIDGDRHTDIVLSPAETKGQRSSVAWFRSPGSTGGEWVEATIAEDVESVNHFVGVADFNRDGRVDVATAAMTQGEDPDEIAVFLNLDEGREWRKEVLAGSGSHSMRVFDANGDFYPDVFGANWHIEDYDGGYPVQLWLTRSYEQGNWQRHEIDGDRPGQATFVFSADLDADGLADIVTGAWWYRNPGSLEGEWQRRAIGKGANNVALVYDFDNDGLPDLLSSGWRGYRQKPNLWQRLLNRSGIREYDYKSRGNEFVWARNEGFGQFTIYKNIEVASGDFLQGANVYIDGKSKHVLLSWHHEKTSLQTLSVPADPVGNLWTWHEISHESSNEAVSSVDIDADGRMDILLGTRWLKYSEATRSWEVKNPVNSDDSPDRHVVADINGDGEMDIVVGFEAVSAPGKIAWYEPVDQPGLSWVEHTVGQLIGPMSLSVSDIDHDGDPDIVVGEHNLRYPERARLVWFENADGTGSQWLPHLIHTGDEHHDGALAVDIDNDGDNDIISIGWGHNRVLVYENRITD